MKVIEESETPLTCNEIKSKLVDLGVEVSNASIHNAISVAEFFGKVEIVKQEKEGRGRRKHMYKCP